MVMLRDCITLPVSQEIWLFPNFSFYEGIFPPFSKNPLSETQGRQSVLKSGEGGRLEMRTSGGMLLEFLKFWDTESVFPDFEGPINIMIYTMKFVI